jgi:hypothetical protein
MSHKERYEDIRRRLAEDLQKPQRYPDTDQAIDRSRASRPEPADSYHTTDRFKRGYLGEDTAMRVAATERDELLLSGKSDIKGTNQGGPDFVTLGTDDKGEPEIKLYDNKVKNDGKKVYSVPALEKNLDKESLQEELRQSVADPARTDAERDAFRLAIDLLEEDRYSLNVSNAGAARKPASGVGPRQERAGIQFVDMELRDDAETLEQEASQADAGRDTGPDPVAGEETGAARVPAGVVEGADANRLSDGSADVLVELDRINTPAEVPTDGGAVEIVEATDIDEIKDVSAADILDAVKETSALETATAVEVAEATDIDDNADVSTNDVLESVDQTSALAMNTAVEVADGADVAQDVGGLSSDAPVADVSTSGVPTQAPGGR